MSFLREYVVRWAVALFTIGLADLGAYFFNNYLSSHSAFDLGLAIYIELITAGVVRSMFK